MNGFSAPTGKVKTYRQARNFDQAVRSNRSNRHGQAVRGFGRVEVADDQLTRMEKIQ